jgi:hypothetical protein
MAVAFFIVFGSLLGYCVHQDLSYYLHNKPPVASTLPKGKV